MSSQEKQIFVAINAHPKSGALLRAAQKKSAERSCGWTAIYVETPDHDRGTAESRRNVLHFLTQAEEMGADILRLEGRDVADAITAAIDHANKNNIHVDSLIVGKTQKEGLLNELRASTIERLAKALRSRNTALQAIPLSGKYYKPSWFERLQLKELRLKDLALALISVLCAFGLSELMRASVTDLEWQVNVHNITAFFLIATVISALRCGMLAGLFAAIISYGCINYFYIQPTFTFDIQRSSEGISFLIFLLSATVISLIGAYTRASAASLSRKERRSQALHTLYRSASEAGDQAHALQIMHEELARLLEMEITFFLPSLMQNDTLEIRYPEDTSLDEKDAQALEKSWQEVRTTGLGAALVSGASWRFEPMVTPNGEIGVLGINIPKHIRLDASFGRLVSAIADQAANILERIELTKMMGESQIREEREKLRAMLLSSVSHDLKTPLASIIGSLSVYKRMKKAGRLDSDTSDELTETALDEAQRLDSFISNILDMTRIESGDITFGSEWMDPAMLVKAVQKRLRLRLRDHTLEIIEPEQPFEVQCDAMMSEQVLQNILDNAGKYSPKGSAITLSYEMENERCMFTIRDEGAGIPEDKLDAVFDKYERLKQSDSQVAGTGLGLAISRAIMEKQGGTVEVSNHPDGGAVFTIALPKARPQNEVAA